jgi:hypothetical protein
MSDFFVFIDRLLNFFSRDLERKIGIECRAEEIITKFEFNFADYR